MKIENTGGQRRGGGKQMADVHFKIFGAHTQTKYTSKFIKNRLLIDNNFDSTTYTTTNGPIK